MEDNLAFYKTKSYCNLLYKYWRKKHLLVYQQISMTKFILTVWTSYTYELAQAIPGQIILVKQVNINVYSIEVRYSNQIFIQIINTFWPSDFENK